MLDRPNKPEMINVHRVYADKEIILYFRMSDPQMIEGLFYNAKRNQKTSFEHLGRAYELIRNRDGSFTVQLSEVQNYTTEAFS